jgi:hypothetical protein
LIPSIVSVLEEVIVMGIPLLKVCEFNVDAEGRGLELLNIKKAIMQDAIMETEMIDFFILFYLVVKK